MKRNDPLAKFRSNIRRKLKYDSSSEEETVEPRTTSTATTSSSTTITTSSTAITTSSTSKFYVISKSTETASVSSVNTSTKSAKPNKKPRTNLKQGYIVMAPKSKIWKYLTRAGIYNLCNICGKSEVCSNTTNLWKHLKGKHLKQYMSLSTAEDRNNEGEDALNNGSVQETEADDQSTKEDNLVPTNTISSVPSSGVSSINLSSSESVPISKAPVALKPTQMKQPTLSNRFKQLSKSDCDRITDAIAYFIAVGTEPYLIVQNKGFRHLLSVTSPTYKIPSPKVFSEKKVPALNVATKQIINSKVSCIDYFGLTSDGWTAPNGHKFISLTCSYIDDDWKLDCHTLACRELNISNTGENIKKLIWDILAEYKMEKKEFASITTDRGSNGLLAVQLMDIESIPCFAHAVNTKMEEMLTLKFIAPTLTKVKGIYSKLSFSSLARKFLAICQHDLHLPQNKMPSTCKHRWWSEIDQFKFVVVNEMALYKFVTTYPDTDQGLLITADDINRMKAILLVMEPVQKYATTLGSETIVSVSIIPPLIKKLDNIFAKFKYHDLVASFEIRKFFREIPKFFNSLYINNKSHVEMATYLDPRFKGERRPDLDRILEIDMNEIIADKKAKAAGAASPTSSQISCLPQNDNSIRKEKRKSALEELFEEDEVANKAHTTDIVTAEINLYRCQLKINIDESPLEWWKGRSIMLPNVSIVAKKYLCLSATAVLSERIFSQGGRVVEEHCEQLIFLNMNDDVVPKNPIVN